MSTFITVLVVAVVTVILVLVVFVGSRKREKGFDSWPAAAKKLSLTYVPWLLVSEPKIRGHLDGHGVLATVLHRKDGKKRTMITHVRVHYRRAAHLDAEITRESFHGGKGAPEGMAPALRSRLIEVFRACPETRVGKREVTFERIGVADGPGVMAAVRHLTGLATLLGEPDTSKA